MTPTIVRIAAIRTRLTDLVLEEITLVSAATTLPKERRGLR